MKGFLIKNVCNLRWTHIFYSYSKKKRWTHEQNLKKKTYLYFRDFEVSESDYTAKFWIKY